MRRPFGIATLFLVAFATILGTLVATGVTIEREASLVHAQTREILENGLPSIVSATRLKQLLAEMRVAETHSREERLQREMRHDNAANEFRRIVVDEKGARFFFPDEPAALADIEQSFARLQADDRALRLTAMPNVQHELQYAEDWSRLEVACERFEALNQGGIQIAKEALEAVAAREEHVLIAGVLCCLLLAGTWALVLSRLIATPLRSLDSAVARLPSSDEGFEQGLLLPAAAEIRALAASLHELTLKLREADVRRASAQHDLEAALHREGELNRDLARVNSSLDRQVQLKTAALETANERLSDLIEDLRQRDRARSSFLAAISHELRTPLAVMKASMVTLQNLELAPEAEARLLSSAAEEAEHLTTLVEDLLDVARMDSGKFRIEPMSGVSVQPVVEAVTAGLSTLFEDQEVRLARAIAPALPPLTADPERLRQILRNLLENAAKYSRPGSTVTLAIAAEQPPDGPARLQFEVRDEGPGVPPEVLPGLFQPFVQRPERQAGGGVGLGLAIARQLVAAHGGEIGLRPNLPTGSVFWFWLPLQASPIVTK